MGLTRMREGTKRREVRAERRVLLMGNPNVGKSTVFNALTGLNRHTGNWTGKTVDSAVGIMKRGRRRYALVDLPGCYSLEATSPEEATARDCLENGGADCVVIVCDASCLERNLNLVLQTLVRAPSAVVCVNLADEARKRGVTVDTELLSRLLGVPAVLTSASSGEGLGELVRAIELAAEGEKKAPETGEPRPMWERAEEIARLTVTRDADTVSARRLRLDRFLTGRFTGALSLLALLAVVFFITIVGANPPSLALSKLFSLLLNALRRLLGSSAAARALVDGGLKTLFTVVAVMLPPMAIFFPLFTFLEDLGLLPRIAFNLDRPFSRCGACGKSALTMCMGFGCNAAGVVGCRIIESPRERLAAILTNSLIPCNGRFPALTALIAAFIVTGGGLAGGLLGALCLTGLILVSVAAVLAVTALLTKTLLKGKPSSFVLELPPFRRPRIGQILVRSLLDRTLFVLGRAAAAAFPAGVAIWLLTEYGLMPKLTGLLDPLGRLMGLDGTVLAAFTLGLPANELVTPLMLALRGADSLAECGLDAAAAFRIMLLMLFHSPCITTLLTIRRETRSLKWTLLAWFIPTALGVIVCIAANALGMLAG